MYKYVPGPRSRASVVLEVSWQIGSRALLELRGDLERDQLLARCGLLRVSVIFRLMYPRGVVEDPFGSADEKWQVGAGTPDVRSHSYRQWNWCPRKIRSEARLSCNVNDDQNVRD